MPRKKLAIVESAPSEPSPPAPATDKYDAMYRWFVEEFSCRPTKELAEMLAASIVIEQLDAEIRKEVDRKYAPLFAAQDEELRRLREQARTLHDKLYEQHQELWARFLAAPIESARRAALTKTAKWRMLGDYAFELASAGHFKSTRHAAVSIAGKVRRFASERGASLSEGNAPRTIGEWLKGRGYIPAAR